MTESVRDPQLLKGAPPMLVLLLLTEHESYGYELVTRLRDDGLADIATGTVYPVLSRLDREGLISSRPVASSSGPARKYYAPSGAGRTSPPPSAPCAAVADARLSDRLGRPRTALVVGGRRTRRMAAPLPWRCR